MTTSKSIDYSLFGEITAKPRSKINKLVAKNMTESWALIPRVTHHDEVDISEVEALRKQLNAEQTAKCESANKGTAHITLLPFILKATVEVLKKFPEFNASLDEAGDNLILKHYYNIGIAVDTPNGLIVPVIKGVDSMSLDTLAKTATELAERTRAGKLEFADAEGGSFSVTSLGPTGGTGFTPIIKVPEVAILGVSREIDKVVARDGEIVIRPMLPLSLSYDHRAIDGAMAARFMSHLKQILAEPDQLLN